MPGPVPKRSQERRRRNDAEETETVPVSGEVVVPEPSADWHPVARLWFESLGTSGQRQFYESSDWAAAYVIAESISRELNPQPMVVGRGEDAHVEMVELPPKGASLAAWLKGMTALLVTEGDRRRMRIELERADDDSDTGNAPVLAEVINAFG